MPRRLVFGCTIPKIAFSIIFSEATSPIPLRPPYKRNALSQNKLGCAMWLCFAIPRENRLRRISPMVSHISRWPGARHRRDAEELPCCTLRSIRVVRHCWFWSPYRLTPSFSAGVGSAASRSVIGHAHNMRPPHQSKQFLLCGFATRMVPTDFVPQNRCGRHRSPPQKAVSDKEDGLVPPPPASEAVVTKRRRLLRREHHRRRFVQKCNSCWRRQIIALNMSTPGLLPTKAAIPAPSDPQQIVFLRRSCRCAPSRAP